MFCINQPGSPRNLISQFWVLVQYQEQLGSGAWALVMIKEMKTWVLWTQVHWEFVPECRCLFPAGCLGIDLLSVYQFLSSVKWSLGAAFLREVVRGK